MSRWRQSSYQPHHPHHKRTVTGLRGAMAVGAGGSLSSGDVPGEQYDPFRRRDRYGLAGGAAQPCLERARLALAAVALLPLRASAVLATVLALFCTCRLSALLPHPLRARVVPAAGKLCSRACLLSLGFLKVRWIELDKQAPPTDRAGTSACLPAALVANHCSWCDILVFMSRYFPSFVARESTQDLPLIGYIR